METKKLYKQIIFYFSIIYAVLAIIFMLFQPQNLKPNTTTSIMGFVSLILFISIPIVAIKMFKQQGGEITLGKAIKLGVLIGLLGGLIVGIYAAIYFTYIKPEAVDQTMELSRQILEDSGKLNSDMIEKQMEITRKFFVPLQIVGQIFTGVLYGLIGGLIGGLFYKPKNTDY